MLAQELEPEEQPQTQGAQAIGGRGAGVFPQPSPMFWGDERLDRRARDAGAHGQTVPRRWVSLLSFSGEGCCAVAPCLNRKRELCVDSGSELLWPRAEASRAAVWTATTTASRDCTLAVVEPSGMGTEAVLLGNSVLSGPF